VQRDTRTPRVEMGAKPKPGRECGEGRAGGLIFFPFVLWDGGECEVVWRMHD
jgi:hypothetical protein